MFQVSVIFAILFLNSSNVRSAPVNVDNSKTVALYNEFDLYPNGDYSYRYKLDDGQAVDVEGKLKDINENQVYIVTGSYTFQGDDGKVYTVYFVADENGYRTTKDKIAEKPPPTGLQPRKPPSYKAQAPVKPGGEDDINSRTLAGAFG